MTVTAEYRARHHLGMLRWHARRRRIGNTAGKPDPMPARLADGTRVWLHYSPLRWERHP